MAFVVDFISYTIVTAIVISFALASYYNLRWLLLASRKPYSWIKRGWFGIYFAWVIAYLYVLAKFAILDPVIANSFALIVVRPLMLATGMFAAFSSRARYMALFNHGEHNAP